VLVREGFLEEGKKQSLGSDGVRAGMAGMLAVAGSWGLQGFPPEVSLLEMVAWGHLLGSSPHFCPL
jgi:hypothetical protein